MSCNLRLSPVFTCIRQNIKLSLSHALLYGFIVFKYVILILRKDKYILGRNDLYFWGSGEELVFFLGIWGANLELYCVGWWLMSVFGQAKRCSSGGIFQLWLSMLTLKVPRKKMHLKMSSAEVVCCK